MFYSIRFELLEVLTFDSVRRRMSVVVRANTGNMKRIVSADVVYQVPSVCLTHTFFFFFVCVCR